MIAYTYDDANRMTATTLPSGTGIVSSFSYDNADRLTGISHVKDGSTTIASVAYTLDDVGNRTQRVDQQGTHTYAYDDLYRLTSVTYPDPSTTSYTFDAFGNRTSMTDASGTTDYTYDDADRLTEVDPPSASAVAYTWDDNGNLTDRGSDEFAWDEADRMVSATVNSTTTTFAYRGDGLRESRTVGMSTTTFTWDINSGLPVVLYDGSYYLYGFGLEAMEQSGDWYYFLADGLGSTMAIVDDAGAVQNSYTYDVYGEPTVTGSLANEFDFAGQQTDGDTGLQYLRARYMDPETGMFLSRDPLAVEPSWLGSNYGYAGGNPCSATDPTGLAALGGPKKGANCDQAWTKIANLAKSMARGLVNLRANKNGWSDLDPARIRHKADYNVKQGSLRNWLQFWDDDNSNNRPPPGFDPDLFLAAEYLSTHTLEEALEQVDWPDGQAGNILERGWKKLTSGWDAVRDVINNLPPPPDVWWDGDPIDPWTIPIPGPIPGPSPR